MPIRSPRRLVEVLVTPALLPSLVASEEARAVWVTNPVPSTAIPLYMERSDAGNVRIVLEDESFAEVTPGQPLPVHTLRFEVRPAPPAAPVAATTPAPHLRPWWGSPHKH